MTATLDERKRRKNQMIELINDDLDRLKESVSVRVEMLLNAEYHDGYMDAMGKVAGKLQTGNLSGIGSEGKP